MSEEEQEAWEDIVDQLWLLDNRLARWLMRVQLVLVILMLMILAVGVVVRVIG